jgi:hypothetical protein
MPEEKPKPIPLTTYVVTTYVCPICNHDIFVNLEEAEKHVAMPLDTLLPVGLTFKQKSGYEIYFYILTEEFSVCLRDHGRRYLPRGFPKETGYESLWYTTNLYTSKIFKSDLRDQPEVLMTEEEFEDFKKKYETFMRNNEEKRKFCFYGLKAENLVRTTPELEAIVAEGKLAREIMYKAGLCNREEDKLAREIMEEAGLKERILHERHEDWKRQVAYFEKHKEEIRKQYGEAYVAICDGQIIASDPDEWKLVERTEKEKRDRLIFIASVKDSETVIEFPSPEIWEGR